jgi:hypothetical protein
LEKFWAKAGDLENIRSHVSSLPSSPPAPQSQIRCSRPQIPWSRATAIASPSPSAGSPISPPSAAPALPRLILYAASSTNPTTIAPAFSAASTSPAGHCRHLQTPPSHPSKSATSPTTGMPPTVHRQASASLAIGNRPHALDQAAASQAAGRWLLASQHESAPQMVSQPLACTCPCPHPSHRRHFFHYIFFPL